MNVTDFIIDSTQYTNNDGVVTIPWNTVIGFCDQWKNYSTYAHNFYIWLVLLYFILEKVERFYNPVITYTWFNKKQYSFKLTYEIKDIVITVLCFRIIQVWYAVNYILR